MKKVLFCLVVLGTGWTMGCRSGRGVMYGPNTESHLGPGTAPLAKKLADKIANEDTLEPGNYAEYLEMLKAEKDQETQDSLLAETVKHLFKQQPIVFTNDTVTGETVSALVKMSESLGDKDTICLTGIELTAFASSYKKGDSLTSLGTPPTPLQKALVESKSVDSIYVVKNKIEITYKPLTGLRKLTVLSSRIQQKIDALETIQNQTLVSTKIVPRKKPWG